MHTIEFTDEHVVVNGQEYTLAPQLHKFVKVVAETEGVHAGRTWATKMGVNYSTFTTQRTRVEEKLGISVFENVHGEGYQSLLNDQPVTVEDLVGEGDIWHIPRLRLTLVKEDGLYEERSIARTPGRMLETLLSQPNKEVSWERLQQYIPAGKSKTPIRNRLSWHMGQLIKNMQPYQDRFERTPTGVTYKTI